MTITKMRKTINTDGVLDNDFCHVMERKIDFHKEQIKIIKEVTRRLSQLKAMPENVTGEILLLEPAIIKTDAGEIPAIIYEGGKALTLCPYCERLHDKGFFPETGEQINCDYLKETNLFAAIQFDDLFKPDRLPEFSDKSDIQKKEKTQLVTNNTVNISVKDILTDAGEI